jgi:hypothetical protein
VSEDNGPRTIWAATAGCYSDYRVVALFETEADAEAHPFGDSVEEFTLYPIDHRVTVTTVFTVRLNYQDDPNDEIIAWSEAFPDDDGAVARKYARANVEARVTGGDWYIVCRATSRGAAVKSAADRAAEMRDRFMPTATREELRAADRVPLPYER